LFKTFHGRRAPPLIRFYTYKKEKQSEILRAFSKVLYVQAANFCSLHFPVSKHRPHPCYFMEDFDPFRKEMIAKSRHAVYFQLFQYEFNERSEQTSGRPNMKQCHSPKGQNLIAFLLCFRPNETLQRSYGLL